MTTNQHPDSIPTQHKGFTLVELSIVLVIIGLIVSGVVGGQSLINAAKTQTSLKDIEKYKTAVRIFEDQYNSLPGDMPDAEDYWGDVGNCGATNPSAGTGTQTCNGDGDGLIDYDNDFTTGPWRDKVHESWRLWEHLQNADILPGNLTGMATNADTTNGKNSGYAPGINTPKGAYANSLYAIFYKDSSEAPSGNRSRHVIVLGSHIAGTHPGRWHNIVITPAEMKAIDDKIDDGKPYLGKVMDAQGSWSPNCTTSSTPATAKYDVSRSTIECYMIVDID